MCIRDRNRSSSETSTSTTWTSTANPSLPGPAPAMCQARQWPGLSSRPLRGRRSSTRRIRAPHRRAAPTIPMPKERSWRTAQHPHTSTVGLPHLIVEPPSSHARAAKNFLAHRGRPEKHGRRPPRHTPINPHKERPTAAPHHVRRSPAPLTLRRTPPHPTGLGAHSPFCARTSTKCDRSGTPSCQPTPGDCRVSSASSGHALRPAR